ncbi:MAG: TRAP transporter large permease [Desulfovibrio sp.]|nr:TRAP transporter large permease [Desulfovibrio sp.]MBI4958712.1 TRAP transporter large permease [Desulfovibrio sp.]
MISVAIAFFVLMFIGLPIGYVLGVSGVLGLLQIGGANFMAMAPKRYFEGLDLFTFMAMPFFILAGEIMNKSGITIRLVAFTDALVGWMRGGLAHSNIVASTIFAGMTGAAVSDAAALGNTLVPAMVSQGYTRPFACAVTVAGSIIGPTIPPSNLMVIYGSLMGVSIAGLFAAGILPGLLICVSCMAVIAGAAKRLCLPKSRDGFSLWEILKAFKNSIVPLLMPVIILGGILTGVVTPTEAAAIAVLYAVIVGMFVFKTITIRDIFEMCVRTGRVTGIVFLIIAAASILSWWMTFQQIPQTVAAGFLSLSKDPAMIKLMILVLLLFIGMFLDINAALIILAPVLGTLTASIGMDPVHAGIMIVLALNIGLMTPPVGACLFVLCSITGERLENIAKSLWPFIIVEVIVLFVISYWTDLTMFMPRWLLAP